VYIVNTLQHTLVHQSLLSSVYHHVVLQVTSLCKQWPRFFIFGGYSSGSLRDGSPPVGFRGEAPVGGSWSSLQTSFTDFDCAETIKIIL